MLPEIPEEQVRQAIELVAAETLAEAVIAAPPVDALDVARRLGIVIARDGPAPTRARFVRLGGQTDAGQPAIMLADEPRPERRQWAVSHEVGECQAYRVFAELGVRAEEAPIAAREGIANRLAGCLLLPRRWFAAAGTEVDWDLLDLKHRFSTASHELIARRMLEMAPQVIVTLCDNGKMAWRKASGAGRTPPLSPPERDAWLAANTTGRPARCDPQHLPNGVEDVRAWPVHEPGWRREILRTALAEEW